MTVIDMIGFFQAKEYYSKRYLESQTLIDQYRELIADNERIIAAPVIEISQYKAAKERLKKCRWMLRQLQAVSDFLGKQLDAIGGAL